MFLFLVTSQMTFLKVYGSEFLEKGREEEQMAAFLPSAFAFGVGCSCATAGRRP